MVRYHAYFENYVLLLVGGCRGQLDQEPGSERGTSNNSILGFHVTSSYSKIKNYLSF